MVDAVDRFIARQPILDANRNTYGYELLFRSSWENAFTAVDADTASSSMLQDYSAVFGVGSLTEGKPAFINVTADVLEKRYVELLPPEYTVVEVLETVVPTPEVLARIAALADRGFRIALDDVQSADIDPGLFELADIVKVDLLSSTSDAWRAIADRCRPRNISLIAEKVETEEVFQQTARLGYDLFQGYFFAKPKVISRKAIPPQTLAGLEVLAAVSAPSIDLERVERLLKRDMSLVHRLLRYINSAFFGWNKEIASVKQALILLGTNAVRKWVSLVVSVDLARDKPQALVSQAMIRARLCERLAELAPGFSARSQELFLLGLFSFIDAIMERPLEELVDELSLVADIREVLLGGESSLRRVFDYALAVEKASWDTAADLARQLGLDEGPVPELYLETVAWSRELEESMSG